MLSPAARAAAARDGQEAVQAGEAVAGRPTRGGGPRMSKPHDPVPARSAALLRAQALMTPAPVPSISTELLATADRELNRELNRFLFDPPTNPELLRGKKIAI